MLTYKQLFSCIELMNSQWSNIQHLLHCKFKRNLINGLKHTCIPINISYTTIFFSKYLSILTYLTIPSRVLWHGTHYMYIQITVYDRRTTANKNVLQFLNIIRAMHTFLWSTLFGFRNSLLKATESNDDGASPLTKIARRKKYLILSISWNGLLFKIQSWYSTPHLYSISLSYNLTGNHINGLYQYAEK